MDRKKSALTIGRELVELALQGSPVQSEYLGSGGDIAPAVMKDPVDMFPFHPGEGRGREIIVFVRVIRGSGLGQGIKNVINISGFGQIGECP